MSPAPQDSAICKATGRTACLGQLNIVRECIPASVVEDRPGARGWYCPQHGRDVMDRRAKRKAYWEESHKRCSMCGSKMRTSAIVTLVEYPDDPHPVTLEFCGPACRTRWGRTHPAT